MGEQMSLFAEFPVSKKTRRIYPADLAERFKPRNGKPYRPSNGTEGMNFDEVFCCDCQHYDTCEIPGLTMLFEIDEEKYPFEWQYDSQGQPCCTAFQERERE